MCLELYDARIKEAHGSILIDDTTYIYEVDPYNSYNEVGGSIYEVDPHNSYNEVRGRIKWVSRRKFVMGDIPRLQLWTSHSIYTLN